MSIRVETKLSSSPSGDTIDLGFNNPKAQEEFLQKPKAEQQQVTEKQHEFALGINRTSDIVFNTFSLIYRDIYHSPEEKIKSGQKQFIEERIQLKDNLASFEEENPMHSEIISEVQETLEKVIKPQYMRDFNIRDYLIPVKDEGEYALKTKITNKDKQSSAASNISQKIVWNINNHSGTQSAPSTNPEFSYQLSQAFILFHEALHLLSGQTIKVEDYKIIQKNGFATITIDPIFTKERSETNEKLDEATTSMLAIKLLEKSKYGKFIDKDKIGKNSQICGIYQDMNYLASVLKQSELSHYYFTGDFDSLYKRLMEEREKMEPEEMELLDEIIYEYIDSEKTKAA